VDPLAEVALGLGRGDGALDLLGGDAAERIDDVVVVLLDPVGDGGTSRFREAG
jgi:hypothetical protein